jgi:hypothetical protein
VPLKYTPATGSDDFRTGWQVCKQIDSMFPFPRDVLAKLTGGHDLKLPTDRGADTQIVFVGPNRRLAVVVFVEMETPPQILHDLDS